MSGFLARNLSNNSTKLTSLVFPKSPILFNNSSGQNTLFGKELAFLMSLLDLLECSANLLLIHLIAYVVIVLGSFLLISIDNLSMMTNFSAVVACFNNIGPGFDAVGPTCNFSVFSGFSKVVLIFDMLAGRLEIFPILILASKST